jgi:cytochrome P450
MESNFFSKKITSTPGTGFQQVWRACTWLSGYPPYARVPHLRGSLLAGRLPYIQQEDGLISTILEASKLAESSDSGMCSFWIKNKIILLIQKPEYIYSLVHHYEKYINRCVPSWNFFPGPSAIGSQGKLGLKVRNVYRHNIFDIQALEKIEPEIDEICNENIGRLKQEENYLFDPKFYFRNLVVELAARVFMGFSKTNQLDSCIVVNYLTKLLANSNTLNLLGFEDQPVEGFYFKDASYDQVSVFRNEIKNELKEVLLNKHENTLKSSDNLLHSLWKLGKQVNDDTDLTVENLFPDAFFFIAGGAILTLGDSFATIIKLIIQHPAVEKQLLLELEDHIQNSPTNRINFDEVIYLDMIIKEAFRMYPPVPIIPLRSALASFTFQGIEIKQGDNILISPYACHHSPLAWKDPEKFIPERFSKENEMDIQKGSYIPFGLGSRNCIGKRYANKVLKNFIAKLFCEFKVEIVNTSNRPKLEGPSLILSQGMTFQLKPKQKSEPTAFAIPTKHF